MAHVLNKTSLLIWNLFAEDSNLETIEQEVKSHFKVEDNSNVRTDIQETLGMDVKTPVFINQPNKGG